MRGYGLPWENDVNICENSGGKGKGKTPGRDLSQVFLESFGTSMLTFTNNVL